MAVADIPSIGQLFLKVFLGPDAVAPDVVGYLQRLLFGYPPYRESRGSIVYEQEDEIRAAILAVPMRFSIEGGRCDRSAGSRS